MVNPTTAMPEAPMSGLANLMAMKGRDNDSMLVHLSPNEVNNLNKLSGNTMTINPATGLPEGRSRFLEAALPALLSIGAGIATGGMSIPAQMAAAAAASGVGAKLTGKSNDEALTSAVLGGATAGLFGGTGSAGAAGGKELGAQVALDQSAKTAAEKAAALGAQEGVKGYAGTSANYVADNVTRQAARTAEKLASEGTKNVAEGLARRKLSDEAAMLGTAKFTSAPRDVYGNIFADMQTMSPYDAITQTDNLKGLTGIAGREVGGNAIVNQMRDDANRVYPIQEDMSNPIDIYSTPFTQTSMGPFNQQQIASNFISGGSGPYGMNFLNQAYGQEGGPVEEMNQGGLTQFNSIMGNPALQLQNPNPPMQMAGGGSFSPQMGPRGSSQGGKGSGAFSEMLNNPEVLAMLQGSGAPQDTKSYDVLASIGANPVQAMNQGGMTNAGTANSSVIPAIVPLIQAANEQAQARFARGGEIVDGLKAIAGNSNKAFEGRVKGPGDGMSDDIPFNIEGQQPALLARDEYVIPADVVSMIGNGSSDAGSEQIDQTIANIRQTKYGRPEQPPQTSGGLESLTVTEESTPSGEEVEVAGKFEDMMVLPNPPFSVLPPGLNPADFMYMYTDKTNGQHYFKNINTRKYSVFGSGKL